MEDAGSSSVTTWNKALIIPRANALIGATGADIRIGGGEAYYAPQDDYIRVPRPEHFHEPINWFRTVLHELGHWSGHRSRLDRLPDTGFASPAYAREELIAEMASAFLCAELGIVPTVRHADYLGAWLSVLREDSKAIFRAASQASKAADFLLAYLGEGEKIMTDHDPERLARTAAALRKLSPEALQVFLCNRVEGMTYVEIARQEGMTLEQVQQHMLEAIRTIVNDAG
ncbi:zincin-like metallopeptidase domain-containing protein [Sphingobium scionense]